MTQIAGLTLLLLLPIEVVLVFVNPAFAQDGSLGLPPPLFEPVPVVDFRDDRLLFEVTERVSINWQIKIFFEDLHETFTFNPIAKAELKLQHAEERQREIDFLDFAGATIPIEYEERRVQKLNEASAIMEREVILPDDASDTAREALDAHLNFSNEFALLKNWGELNDIKVLYSQLPIMLESSDEIQERYNNKVNSLDTWHEFCIGEFDIESLGTMKTAIDRLEEQCPKLVDLQERFGTDRLQSIVKGTI